jgi:putative glycosyltransferase
MPGHPMALMTGLAHTTGDLIFLSDSDLDEEPELQRSFDLVDATQVLIDP